MKKVKNKIKETMESTPRDIISEMVDETFAIKEPPTNDIFLEIWSAICFVTGGLSLGLALHEIISKSCS